MPREPVVPLRTWDERVGGACAIPGGGRDTGRAMSEENLKTVRDAAAAFNRRDLEAWIEYWTDDVDYRAVEGAPDDHGPIHGREALRVYAQDWLDTFDDFSKSPSSGLTQETATSSRSSGSADAPSSAASRLI
jgi:SnoaL-like domain